MEYNKKQDQLINKGEIILNNGVKIADYIMYKAKYNIGSNYSNLDIIPNVETDFTDNIGNALNHSFSDFKTIDILTALNNTDFEILENTHDEIFKSVKSVFNYFQLSEAMKKQIIEILNFTLEDEELGIYNEFQQYYFDENTLNNCILWCLKECSLFKDKSKHEIIKEIIHYYIDCWLSSRYEVKFTSINY